MTILGVYAGEGVVRRLATGATPPPAVMVLSVFATSTTSIQATWLAPSWGGGVVSHYEVSLNGVLYSDSVLLGGITIGNLTPDTEYTLAVRAVSTDGLLGAPDHRTVTTDSEAPTSNFPDVWDGMIASRSWEAAQSTFDAYTGYQAAGFSYADLINHGGTINSTQDGQVIEGRRGTALRITHNNVTVRGCLFGPGNTYGLYTNPTFNWSGTGLLVEHCTFDGTINSGQAVDKAGTVIQAGAGAATIRYCEFRGWSSGVLAQGGVNVDYSWFTDFYGSSVAGAHVSSLNARGQNIRFYRNLATEGGSPICSIYFDTRPVHNVDIRENLLTARLSTSGNLPSYLLFGKSGDYRTPATGIVVGGNYFGDTVGLDFQFGLQTGLGPVRWGQDGNIQTPNIDFLTGDPI